MGTVQTVKAEQSLQSLKKLSGPEAKVLRDGSAVQIPARELVIGDVILLEAGDMIPADGRLIENASLKVDESALTIGVAMEITGTEVAKDAAAMVLTDDNFATIVKAVENGRNLYQNIKNAIQFLLSGNFGAILVRSVWKVL